jgi:hypothetical protein
MGAIPVRENAFCTLGDKRLKVKKLNKTVKKIRLTKRLKPKVWKKQ